MLKTLFPACASFGPLFIAMGHLFPSRADTVAITFLVGATGALMTSAALIMLFQTVNSTAKASDASKQSIESKKQNVL
ncbi:MAG TPA: hypothetical protein DDZ51_20985 [Planctomycetaceae bacterium]|nr:hypothetical protein [Planctomycetaceae bacterium]